MPGTQNCVCGIWDRSGGTTGLGPRISRLRAACLGEVIALVRVSGWSGPRTRSQVLRMAS
jgi:hypothetical protein